MVGPQALHRGDEEPKHQPGTGEHGRRSPPRPGFGSASLDRELALQKIDRGAGIEGARQFGQHRAVRAAVFHFIHGEPRGAQIDDRQAAVDLLQHDSLGFVEVRPQGHQCRGEIRPVDARHLVAGAQQSVLAVVQHGDGVGAGRQRHRLRRHASRRDAGIAEDIEPIAHGGAGGDQAANGLVTRQGPAGHMHRVDVLGEKRLDRVARSAPQLPRRAPRNLAAQSDDLRGGDEGNDPGRVRRPRRIVRDQRREPRPVRASFAPDALGVVPDQPVDPDIEGAVDRAFDRTGEPNKESQHRYVSHQPRRTGRRIVPFVSGASVASDTAVASDASSSGSRSCQASASKRSP